MATKVGNMQQKEPTKKSELKARDMCFNRALKVEESGGPIADLERWLEKAIVRENAAALLPECP